MRELKNLEELFEVLNENKYLDQVQVDLNRSWDDLYTVV